MSEDSSADKPAQTGWGPIAGTLWSLLFFLGPQFILLPLAPVVASLAFSQNVKLFALYAIVQLITLATITAVMHGYGLKLASIGLGKLKAAHFVWVMGAIPIYFALSAIVTSIAALVLPPDLMNQQQELGFTKDGSPLELALAFIALVVVTPFVEEIICRGFLLRGYRRFGLVVSSLLVSLLFAIAHWQVNVGIDVFVLSLVLCFVRIKTDSLWPAIFIHAFKNFLAFYLLFIMSPEQWQNLLNSQ